MTAVDLGTLGGPHGYAFAINAQGQVVGTSTTSSEEWHPFSWTKSGGMVDLFESISAISDAYGINAAGQIVGEFLSGADATHHAFSWTRAGGLVDLGLGLRYGSAAYAVNDSGQVVGNAGTGTGAVHAVSWTPAGAMIDLGTLGGRESSARGINASGEIVGESETTNGDRHAFSWTQAGGMIDLGTLGGSRSEAAGINTSGSIVGWSQTSSGAGHAFAWTSSAGMVDLGTLGGTGSAATGINAAGQIVGNTTTSTGATHAFSWTPAAGMEDLGTLGGTASLAHAVNDSGQVVGLAATSTGAEHAVLWNTQQEPIGGPIRAPWLFGGGPYCAACAARAAHSAPVGKPVEAQDGNEYQTFSDLAIPGRGLPLAFTRTYNSLAAATNGPLGYGWVDNLAAKLEVSGSEAIVTEENGAQVPFTLAGTTWSAAPRNIETLTHNGDGTWTVIRKARETLTFDASGKLTSLADLNGNALTYSYVGAQLTAVTDSAGRSLTLAYSGGHIATVTDPNVTPNRVVHFNYDERGNLTEVIDVASGRTQFTYDGSHRMLSWKGPQCVITPGCPGVTNAYDEHGRVRSQTDQLSRTTTFVYEGDPSTVTGGETTVTTPNGSVTIDRFQFGEKVSETRGATSPQEATTWYAYDPATLQPTAIGDPNGHFTRMTYDRSGNMLTRTDPLGRTTEYTYNTLNEPLTIKDPAGVTERRAYSPRGDLLKVTRPLVGTKLIRTTTYAYADPTHPGDVTSMTDPAKKVWTYTYDTYGDRISTTDPLKDKSTSTYNTIGWLMSTVSPRGNATGATPELFTTTFAHNAVGQVTETAGPLNLKTKSTYDPEQNLTASTDANGNTTEYVYDAANEQTAVHRSDGTTLHTTYWPDGTVKEQIDGAGHATLYKYDPLQRVVAITDPVGRVTRYEYDRAGNRTAVIDAQNQTTHLVYDAANQLIAISYSDGKTPNVTGIEYDLDGERTAMTDGTGKWSWTWDSLHRLTGATEGTHGTVTYAYELRGLLTTLTYPTGSHVVRKYDNAGRLNTVTDWLGNTTKFSYDADGNITKETLPKAAGITDSTTYDEADQLTRILDQKGTSVLFQASYGRDANGQLTTDSSAQESLRGYHYTPLNQLCYSAASGSEPCASPPNGATPYAYDQSDNLTQMGQATQAYGPANELCWTQTPTTSGNECGSPPAGATTYTYDARGNRTAATPPSGSPTSLGYDQEDRLTSYVDGGTSATYSYNADGLRMAKTVAATTTGFAWDLVGALPAMLEEGATAFLYGPGGQPLEQISGSNAVWLHHDQLGSTRMITNASGAIVGTYSYNPYGAIASAAGTVSTPLMFAGQVRDSESGLYYLRARYYDPPTGQFITRDPAVSATRTAYGYGGGNPLNDTDPSGEAICIGQVIQIGFCGPDESPGGEWGHALGSQLYNALIAAIPNPDYVSGCVNTVIFEACVTHTNTGHWYVAGGPGIGAPGGAVSAGWTYGGSGDQLIQGWSGHLGGGYLVGGGTAESATCPVRGPYVSLGEPGVGGYNTYGIPIP